MMWNIIMFISYCFLFFCLVLVLTVDVNAEETGTGDVVNADSIKTLFEGVAKIPDLGLYGIIAAIILAVIMFGIWLWWNTNKKKITHRKNDEQDQKDQAENKTKNQDASDEWDEAHDNVEDKLNDGEGGSQPRPPEPGGE